IACTLVVPGLTVWQMLNPPLTLINVGFSILGTWLCGSLMGLSLSGYCGLATKEWECECYGIIHDPVRRERFIEVYPDGRVPIQYPWIAGTATTGQETYEFY